MYAQRIGLAHRLLRLRRSGAARNLPIGPGMQPTRSASTRLPVVHVGPDPAGRGGMAAVTRGLLASSLSQRYEQSAIATHRVGAPAKGAFVFAGGLARLVGWSLRNRGGIVHVHSAVRGSLYRKAVVVELARALRHPVVLHIHAGEGDIDDFVAARRPVELRAFARAFRRATALVTVSHAGARRLAAAFGRSDFHVVPNAAPQVAPLPPAPGRPPLTVLYLGGFEDPAKGGAVLVRALPQLVGDGAEPPLHVVLAGPGDPPPQLTGLPPSARTEWRGWLDQEGKQAALAAADVVVLPSISEGLPVMQLEAMAHGRALVVSRVGGMPEVAPDGEAALVVPVGDEAALAAAIRRLAGDPQLRARLGAGAQEAVKACDEEAVVERLDAVYREVLAR